MPKQFLHSSNVDGRNATGNAFGKTIIAHVWGFDWEKEKIWISMYMADAKESHERDWTFEDGIPQGGSMLPEHIHIMFPLLFPTFNWMKVEIFRHGTNMPPEMMRK